MGVTIGGFDFDHAFAHFEQGHIKCAAAQVEDEDDLAFLFIQPVSQGRRGRLVDDSHHFQACDLAGVLCGLALAVVEVRRDGDHRAGDGLPQVGLSISLQLFQDHG